MEASFHLFGSQRYISIFEYIHESLKPTDDGPSIIAFALGYVIASWVGMKRH